MKQSMLEHLYDRYFDVWLHRPWINETERCVTFPLWNLSGQLVGYQRYKPEGLKTLNNNPLDGKYFTRVKEHKVGVWGLETWSFTNTLFVLEGVFDACRLTRHGVSAIAITSNDLSPSTKKWLWMVRQQRPVVAVCDNDENRSGLKLAKYAHRYELVPETDLGEANEDYVQYLIGKYV